MSIVLPILLLRNKNSSGHLICCVRKCAKISYRLHDQLLTINFGPKKWNKVIKL